MDNSQLMQQPNNLKSHGVPSDHGKLRVFLQILRFELQNPKATVLSSSALEPNGSSIPLDYVLHRSILIV